MNGERRFEQSPERPVEPDRRLELLADLTLEGLDDHERAELDLLGATAEDAEPWRLAAAAAGLALQPAGDQGIPDHLRRRVLDEADVFFKPSAFGAYPRRGMPARVVPWLGWIAAAACLMMLVWSGRVPVVPVAPAGPSVEQRLVGVPSVKLVATDHPLAAGAGGELVWSGEHQEGFLTIRGLAEVEPTRGAYQLWIFDDTRDPRFPVDGGVFYVGDAKKTTVVPIRASLPVRRPTLFAITLEPPGGVVVSDRKRLLLTASLSP